MAQRKDEARIRKDPVDQRRSQDVERQLVHDDRPGRRWRGLVEPGEIERPELGDLGLAEPCEKGRPTDPLHHRIEQRHLFQHMRFRMSHQHCVEQRRPGAGKADEEGGRGALHVPKRRGPSRVPGGRHLIGERGDVRPIGGRALARARMLGGRERVGALRGGERGRRLARFVGELGDQPLRSNQFKRLRRPPRPFERLFGAAAMLEIERVKISKGIRRNAALRRVGKQGRESVRTAGPFEDDAQLEPRLRHRRLAVQRRAIGGLRLVEPAQSGKVPAALEQQPGLGKRRQRGKRLVMPSEPTKQLRDLERNRRIAGGEHVGPATGRERLLQLPRLDERGRQIGLDRRHVWAERRRTPQRGDAALQVPVSAQRIAKIVPDLPVAGLARDDPRITLRRLLEAANGLQNIAVQPEQRQIVRSDAQTRLGFPRGALDVAALKQSERPAVRAHRIS